MLERQERTALFLLGTVLAILLAGHLILTTVGNAPFAAPYSESSREGDLVVLSGKVEAATRTATGGHLLLSVNGTRVFIPSPASRAVSVQLNETVRIVGIVQVFQGEKEVAVRDAQDILKEPSPSAPS